MQAAGLRAARATPTSSASTAAHFPARRHADETHPEYGYAVTREVMETDIRIMKENNINAYVASPEQSVLVIIRADKYGIYVVDEANLEVHSNMIYAKTRALQSICRTRLLTASTTW